MISKKQQTSLGGFKVPEVSIVDRGANKKKPFPIYKQESTMTQEEMETILKAVLETEIDEEKTLDELIAKAEVSDKGKNAAKAALRILSGFKDEMPPELMKALGEVSGMSKQFPPKPDEEDEKKIKKLEAENKKLKEEAVAKNKDGDEGKVPEAIQKQFDSLEAENKELKESNEKITKALDVQKDTAELAVWEGKAKDELAHFPGKSFEEIAKSLHALAKVDPKLAKEQFASMKAASDALKESEIFKARGGRGADAEGSVMEKIEKMADELLEKSTDTDLTKEKAIGEVLKRRPDLYDSYIEESDQA